MPETCSTCHINQYCMYLYAHYLLSPYPCVTTSAARSSVPAFTPVRVPALAPYATPVRSSSPVFSISLTPQFSLHVWFSPVANVLIKFSSHLQPMYSLSSYVSLGLFPLSLCVNVCDQQDVLFSSPVNSALFAHRGTFISVKHALSVCILFLVSSLQFVTILQL